MGSLAPASPIVNALTVDVEDYFQVGALECVVDRERWGDFQRRVVPNTNRLLDIFNEHGVSATFFVLGWVGEREPALVRRIAAEGHEIASHGYSHRLVYQQTPGEFREDVRRSKTVLESLCGQPVLGYRAPSYSITERSLWALEVLQEEHFMYDASIFPIHHDRYGIPSAPRHPHFIQHGPRDGAEEVGPNGSGSMRPGILEIPASTIRVAGVNLPVAGGGYFRLLPYGWTRRGVYRVNRHEGKPVVFYLHPWEVDPDQPRMAAPWLSRFRHYRNLHLTEGRLRRLLKDFQFDTIAGAILPGTVGL